MEWNTALIKFCGVAGNCTWKTVGKSICTLLKISFGPSTASETVWIQTNFLFFSLSHIWAKYFLFFLFFFLSFIFIFFNWDKPANQSSSPLWALWFPINLTHFQGPWSSSSMEELCRCACRSWCWQMSASCPMDKWMISSSCCFSPNQSGNWFQL